MTEVIPAIMPRDHRELEDYARQFRGLVKSIQIDVMDGVFVPAKSWPYAGYRQGFDDLVSEKEGFPLWKELDYEADLMIANPEEEAPKWLNTGVKRIIFHIESIKDPNAFFAQEAIADEVRRSFIEIGIALNIDTPNDVLYPILDAHHADFVQFMGIAKIGYQGEVFDERVLPKIARLRERYPELIMSIDGGVNIKTAGELVKAGINRLVSGSAVLKSEDPEGVIREMSAL
jgi:ribulose-phosphate 3-epimerase